MKLAVDGSSRELRPGRPSAAATLRELEHEAGALPVDELPAALEGAERLAAAYRKRVHVALLASTAPTPVTDRLLTVKEAAPLLGRSEDHLYRHADQYPFTIRDGRGVRFALSGIRQYIADQQQGP